MASRKRTRAGGFRRGHAGKARKRYLSSLQSREAIALDTCPRPALSESDSTSRIKTPPDEDAARDGLQAAPWGVRAGGGARS